MIYIVIGTKAQLIKMAPVMVELKKRNIPYRYISTGQHLETIEEILCNFSLSGPDVTLYQKGDVVSLKSMFVWSLIVLFKSIFKKRSVFGRQPSKKDFLLVHGDTLSTLLGAFMGRLARVKVVHVESGLRSFNYLHPFPEELTRVLTFRLAHVMFCPDEFSVSNISRIKGEVINTFGNTLYDSWRYFGDSMAQTARDNEAFGVVSLHRYENFKSRATAEKIVSLIEVVAENHTLRFVMHKPTERALKRYDLVSRLEGNKNISFMSRMSYFDFMILLQQASFLVSDGGSNQEECFYMGKPLLLLREKTERNEGLGKNCLLSCFSPGAVRQFSLNVEEYRQEPYVAQVSPSSIIVNRLGNDFRNH